MISKEMETVTPKELQEVSSPKIDEKTIKDFLFSSDTKLTAKQQTMFLELAMRSNLDPFKREIYAVVYGSSFNIVTGYQTYIQRAEASGLLDGWECNTIVQKGIIVGASIVIYRKDFSKPFKWTVPMGEFNTGKSSWAPNKMPGFMIKKVCIGQGFRLAFPNQVGCLPYLLEEIEDQYYQKPPKSEPKIIPKPSEPLKLLITPEQVTRLHTIATKYGVAPADAKKVVADNGFSSSKLITTDKYEKVCDEVKLKGAIEDIEKTEAKVETIEIPNPVLIDAVASISGKIELKTEEAPNQ